MEFNEVILNRSSTRKFGDKKVPREDIIKILEAGNCAPTAKNLQPQVVYVVSSREGLKKIDEISPCRYNAPCCLMVCVDLDKAFKKPDHSTYEIDASIVATHMMLAATNIGIDNIWIECFDAALAKKVFALPDNIQPVCILDLGYRADDCPKSANHDKRKALEETVRYL